MWLMNRYRTSSAGTLPGDEMSMLIKRYLGAAQSVRIVNTVPSLLMN